MTCGITYSGNWAPVMRWFNSVTSRNFTDEVITLTTNETTVTSQLTVTSSAGLHGSKIVCVTSFTQTSSPLSTNATNIPSYTYTWTSPMLNVQCKCGNVCGNDVVYVPNVFWSLINSLGGRHRCPTCDVCCTACFVLHQLGSAVPKSPPFWKPSFRVVVLNNKKLRKKTSKTAKMIKVILLRAPCQNVNVMLISIIFAVFL